MVEISWQALSGTRHLAARAYAYAVDNRCPARSTPDSFRGIDSAWSSRSALQDHYLLSLSLRAFGGLGLALTDSASIGRSEFCKGNNSN